MNGAGYTLTLEESGERRRAGLQRGRDFSASARPQPGLHPSCQPCTAVRTRAGRGARMLSAEMGQWVFGDTSQHSCSLRAVAYNRGVRSSQTRVGRVQRQNKANKTSPKMLQKVACRKSRQCVPVFPLHHRSRAAISLQCPGSLPGVLRSLPGVAQFALTPAWRPCSFPFVPWSFFGSPAPSLMSPSPPLDGRPRVPGCGGCRDLLVPAATSPCPPLKVSFVSLLFPSPGGCGWPGPTT